MRSYLIVFRGGCTILHSHQWVVHRGSNFSTTLSALYFSPSLSLFAPSWIISVPLSKPIDYRCGSLFLDFDSTPVTGMSHFMPAPHCLDYCGFELESVISPILLFQDCFLAIMDSLHLCVTFRIGQSIYGKNKNQAGILIGIVEVCQSIQVVLAS